MRNPLIIYVSGAPGSGKTSLARIISEQLYIPHVSSDLVQGTNSGYQPDVPVILDFIENEYFKEEKHETTN